MKEYLELHSAELKSKKLGFFLCCGLPENLERNFSANFPRELLDAAVARECFGGVLDKSKMSLGHRLITRMMEGATAKDGKGGPRPGRKTSTGWRWRWEDSRTEEDFKLL